ncbi:MAG: hypothetical protein ACRENA_04495, partial [Vulcanimicrobiaceae bacterium]
MGAIAKRAGLLLVSNVFVLLLFSVLKHVPIPYESLYKSNPAYAIVGFSVLIFDIAAFPVVLIYLAHQYRRDTFTLRQGVATVDAHLGQYFWLGLTALWQSFVIAGATYFAILFSRILLHGEIDGTWAVGALRLLSPLLFAPMGIWLA